MKPRRLSRFSLAKVSAIRLKNRFTTEGTENFSAVFSVKPPCPLWLFFQALPHGIHVLITATGQIDNYDLIALHLARNFQSVRYGMRRFQSRNDPFQPGQSLKGVQSFIVGNRSVFDPT